MAKRADVTAEAGVGKPTSTDALNGDGLGTLCAGGEWFLWRIEGRVEKRIDEGRLAEARLACTPTRRVSFTVLHADRDKGLRRPWCVGEMKRELTDDHNGEVEALLDGLSVDLVGQICKPNEAGRCGSGWATYEGEMDIAHAWSFLRTAAGRPGVPGVAGLSPYSDMVAAAVAGVDGEDAGEQAVAKEGECDDGAGRTVRIHQERLWGG